MKILDRYLLRRFLLILTFALVAATFVVIFVDMVGNLGKFIDKDVPRALILQFYVYYIPQLLVLSLPIAMLLSSLFSVGQMARHNELTAIKSAGVSPYRTFVPLFGFALLVSVSALVFAETVVPPANQHKRDIETRYLDPFGQKSRRFESNVFLRDRHDRRIFIGQFDYIRNAAQKVTILRYDDRAVVERLDAPRMVWREGGWVLYDGYQRVLQDEMEIATPFDTLYEKSLDITPEAISRFRIDPQDMSYRELKAFIREVRRNGADPNRWLVDLYFRLSLPFANLIMVLFGAPLASDKNRSSPLFGFMVSLTIAFVYYGSNRLVQTLGQNGSIAPPVAAWATNVFFLLLGGVLLYHARK